VLDWQTLLASDAFRQLDFIQELDLQSAGTIRTTRCPVRIDRQVLKSRVSAPAVGQHTAVIEAEFELDAP
jgi:crotonobetainyl-CoA:carnitine CoA-transferase CaiB-like acyl-CoA transferase